MSCKKCKCKVCSCIKNDVPKIAVNGIVQNQNENDVVNIKVPTKTSQLINDSGFGQGNGGGTGGQKIEDIRVNGELVPIINKEAIMNVPTKTSNLINDSNFVTKIYVDTHIVNRANPHNVTKEQVGLGNVDNTSDLSKPISTATQLALDSKIPTTDVKSEVVYQDLKPVNSVAIEKHSVKKIHTIADLRNTVGEYEGQIIELLGYYESGDKDPLKYKWTTTKGIEDGGAVINSGNGSWVTDFNGIVNILHYGAIPNTPTYDNKSIIDKALTYCMNNKKTLFVPNGVYYMSHYKKVLTNNVNIIGESRYQSIFKRIDNTVVDKWSILFELYTNGNTHIDVVNLENLTIDSNRRGQNIVLTNPNLYAFEQAATFKVYCVSTSKVNTVSIEKCVFIDPVADDIQVAPSNTVKNISNLICKDILFVNRNAMRSSILFGSAVNNVDVSNIFEIKNGVYSARIESEFTLMNEFTTYINIVNVNIGRLEMGGDVYDNKKLHGNISNINCSETTILSGGVFNVSNSIITHTEDSQGWVSSDCKISNSTIVFKVKDNGDIQTLQLLNSYKACSYTFNNVIFKPSSVSENSTSPCIKITPRDSSQTPQKAVFNNCTFDNGFDKLIHFTGYDLLETNNCTLNSKSYAILSKPIAGGFKQCYKSSNDNIVTGNHIYFDNARTDIGEYSVVLSGEFVTNIPPFGVRLPEYQYISFCLILSTRTFYLNSLPTRGIEGDIVVLNDANKTRYRATNTSTTSVTWEQLENDATPTVKGSVNQSTAVANVASVDATDLATALTLINELKSKLNAKLTADRNSGQQAIQ